MKDYHTKNQKDLKVYEKYNHLYMNTKMTTRLEISDQYFKAAIIKMIQ